MAAHVAYEEFQARTAADCLNVIRQCVERGWQIVQIRGAERGPFFVVFRMDDER